MLTLWRNKTSEPPNTSRNIDLKLLGNTKDEYGVFFWNHKKRLWKNIATGQIYKDFPLEYWTPIPETLDEAKKRIALNTKTIAILASSIKNWNNYTSKQKEKILDWFVFNMNYFRELDELGKRIVFNYNLMANFATEELNLVVEANTNPRKEEKKNE